MQCCVLADQVRCNWAEREMYVRTHVVRLASLSPSLVHVFLAFAQLAFGLASEQHLNVEREGEGNRKLGMERIPTTGCFFWLQSTLAHSPLVFSIEMHRNRSAYMRAESSCLGWGQTVVLSHLGRKRERERNAARCAPFSYHFKKRQEPVTNV